MLSLFRAVHSVNSNGDDDSPQQRSGAYNLCLNSWTSTGPVMIGLDSTGLELGRNDWSVDDTYFQVILIITY